AWEKTPLTVEQVLGSRMVSSPLTVRDCCLVTDGGGALVMTSAARAKTLRKPPAFVLGTGETISHQNISSMPDLTGARETPPHAAALRAGHGRAHQPPEHQQHAGPDGDGRRHVRCTGLRDG